MALKDLIAEHGKVTEEMIETIILGFVRYELNPNAIVFTQEGAALGKGPKVLIYLVATLGWQYLIDEHHTTETKPADLEVALGINGGTLRPILKKLKDNHLLAVIDGHYIVRPSNLDAVGRVAKGEMAALSSKKATRNAKRKPAGNEEKVQSKDGSKKDKKKSGVPIRVSLNKLIAEGFFTEHRTLAQICSRLDEKAITIKVTSLSGPIAEYVRDNKLERKKIEKIENKSKTVWAYKAV